MEVQVQELIEKIRNEGIKDAEIKAAGIIKEAESKAEEIISKARKEAVQITAKAKEDAQKSEQSGREALRQAGRDLVLNLQLRITELFNRVIKKAVAQALDNKIMGETIVRLISSWQGDMVDIRVELSEKDFADLENYLLSKLAEQIKDGLTVKPSASLDSGFFVAVKDGSAYHNFSAEGIAEVLSVSLNPRISALLSEGVKGRTEG